MQHIVHIFLGEKLRYFRDVFASTFRQLHADIEKSLFTAISLTIEKDCYNFKPDMEGISLDGGTVDKGDLQTGLSNYFDGLYRRKVTVENPGNQSLIVVVWVQLYSDNVFDVIREITRIIDQSQANIHVEVAGFTHDAVSCFITDERERLAPEVYRKYFNENIENLHQIRQSLSALRLIENRNTDNVSLNLNTETMARICAEHSALLCKHYLSINTAVVDPITYPFETFGISSIIFDIEYYKSYIRNRIVTDKLEEQGIGERTFNLNTLAKQTDPILKDILKDVGSFYEKQTTHAKAILATQGDDAKSSIVATIDNGIKSIKTKLQVKLNQLLASGQITVFESEALLALVLGEDCEMFESSAVNADETTLDDIIDNSARFFINLENDNEECKLNDVFLSDLKQIRNGMRNIAVANRKREERLTTLKAQIKDSQTIASHIDKNKYHFGGTDYKLDLEIDDKPLEQKYEAHDTNIENIDLRSIFSPIRNQGHQGSCSSFAVSSAIEVLSQNHKRYSPAFLYWTARKERGTTDSDSGSSLYDIIHAATQKGVCLEESMPYNPDIFTMEPTESALDEAQSCRVVEAKTVDLKLRDIKSALSDGFPVIIATRIFDSFSETKHGFIQHPSAEETKEERKDGHGRHAMVVCGYSDKERIFVVRNSWGTDFGDNGYCYIPYSYAQKYFLQACIISKLSQSAGCPVPPKQTIHFNMSDNNIEVAILQNLIEEDKYALDCMNENSAQLKTEWTENIEILANVNNQIEIIKRAEDALREDIENQSRTIAVLQRTKKDKIDKFKRIHIKLLLAMAFVCIVCWGIYTITESTGWLISTGIVTIIFTCTFSTYQYRWRSYRQELIDEIQEHSNKKNLLVEEEKNLGIKAHIHGSVLREIEDYKLWLSSEYHKLYAFNYNLICIYNQMKEELILMTPTVPYPFLSVLDNNLLDKYYCTWKDKMIDSINIKPLFDKYTLDADLSQLIKADESLNTTVVRGLKNFSMKAYATMQNRDKWQFLPDAQIMAKVIPDMDNRAKPFCAYNQDINNPLAKYICINGITTNDIQSISKYFTQSPSAIDDPDPYCIWMLNILRYNLK